MNLSKIKLGKSIVIKSATKTQLTPGQRWTNKKETLTLMKKYDGKFWIVKDKFGDQKKMTITDLLKKLKTDKLTPEPKSRLGDFINEILPIAKRYFNPIATGLLLSGIKKVMGENSRQKIISSTETDKFIDVGEKQNEALEILTDIYSDLNFLTREILSAAPEELRSKSTRVTNEVRELLDLVISMLPPIK